MALTPFGFKIRQMRKARHETLAQTAKALGVSSAYLSALEHGNRGKPSPRMMHLICQHFNIIWDEADALSALADLSKPVVKFDLSQASQAQASFINALEACAHKINAETYSQWFDTLPLEQELKATLSEFVDSQSGDELG